MEYGNKTEGRKRREALHELKSLENEPDLDLGRFDERYIKVFMKTLELIGRNNISIDLRPVYDRVDMYVKGLKLK